MSGTQLPFMFRSFPQIIPFDVDGLNGGIAMAFFVTPSPAPIAPIVLASGHLVAHAAWPSASEEGPCCFQLLACFWPFC